MPLALKRVCDRFPRLREQAADVFARDENFRDLCENYDACAETLARLEYAQPPEGMVAEYTALLLRLERELLRHLGGEPERGES